MEPETEIIVFGILVSYFDVFSGNIEMLLAKSRVEAVIIQHHGWLYSAIEGNLIPVAMEKEPWPKPNLLNGGVITLVCPAWNDAPATILPMLSGHFSTWCHFMFLDYGLLYFDEKANISREDLSHLAMAEHDEAAFLIGKETTLLTRLIDDTDGGEELVASHGEKIGQFCLGVHAVDDLLDLFEVFLCLSLMNSDRRLG